MSKHEQPTLREFLEGSPVTYPAANGKRKSCIATLQDETTVAINDPTGMVTFASIPAGTAKNLYYNLTRKPHV